MKSLAYLTFAFAALGCGGGSSEIDGVDAGSETTDGGGAGSYCPVVGYEACGGDLRGTWAFRSLCPDDPDAAAALCEHPFDDREVCTGEGNEAICDSSIAGTLTFHADGTLDVATESTTIGTWNFTDACLEAAVSSGTTAEERCASLATDRLTCTYDGSCTCVGDPIVETDTNTATYAVNGNDVTLGEDPPASYCIAGDILTMDYYAYHPISWRYWVLERQ